MQFSFETKFNHIGVATNDHKKTGAFYEALGYTMSIGGYDPEQNVYGYFYTKRGFPTIELLCPNDEKSPINNILNKNGVTPYHICYELVGISMEDAIRELRRERFLPTCRPTLSKSLGDRRVCFLYHKEVGIIEIVEGENVRK